MTSPSPDWLGAGPDYGSPLAAPVDAWLVEGGDDRIALDPDTGLNRYGCGVAPDDSLTGFGSSTASTISRAGFEAAEARRLHLAGFGSIEGAWVAGAAELKARLANLCGLPAEGADRIVLSASGTDVCRLAADGARGGAADGLPVILPEPDETGRGVPDALGGQGRVTAVRLREPDGRPRPADEVDAEVERLCAEAIGRAGRALLCLLDVSKTGLIAPSVAGAARLRQRFGPALTVLVDACQFRLSADSLGAYLDLGFPVAVTGSKFLGGPAFSGALILPMGEPAPPLPEPPSLGLLLRWEAAVTELSLFRALPQTAVAGLVDAFAAAVEADLADSPAFERLPTPPLHRLGPGGWDSRPTIFSFLPRREGRPLSAEATQALYGRLQGVRLGQPVAVGVRDGDRVSALRLALSARQITVALTTPKGSQALIARARATLARTAEQIAA